MPPLISQIELLYGLVPLPSLIVDATRSIAWANKAFLTFAGVGLDDVLGRPTTEIFLETRDAATGRDEAGFSAALERVFETGKSSRMRPTSFDVRWTPRASQSTGDRFWEPLFLPVPGSDGRISHVLIQTEDITERIRRRQFDDERLSALAEANNLYRAMYHQGLFAGRLDLSGNVVDVNESSLVQCGFTRDEVIGRPFWECGWWNRSPEVQAWIKDGFDQALRGEAFRGESRYFRSDGTERIVEYACMPIKNEEGQVVFVVPTGLDVTERHQASRDNLATKILESITDGFFAVGRDWRFIYVNRQGERLLGRQPGDLLGKVIWEEYPGLRGSDFEQAYRKAESEGVASSFTAYYPDHDRYYEVHVYPAVYGISIYFNDISDRKRQEIELNRLAAESEKQRRVYEAALSNTPDLVYVFGLDHRFVYANEALLLMWGRTREQAIGKNCLELGYEPWHAAMHDREIEQVVATKKPIRGEVPFTGTQGRRIYDYIFVPVIGSDDEVVAVAGTTRDVTERQQAEQAIREQSEQLRLNDRRKDEFLAMLAHELRNPLSAVGNAVTVLKMSDEAEHQDFAKEVIERQVRQLARLIDDLLDVSRITTGKIRLRRDLVDAGSILRQAVETVRPLMTERNHKLVVDLREQVLPLRADSTRIEQVVVNLLTNAAKYTPNGGEIRLTAWLEDDKILIEVKDNGIGISPEILPEMFHLFAQGERSIARSEGGLGIGLTIVEKLAELHGGSVDASSGGIGLGSTFTVRLPAANNPATPTKADDLSQSQRQSGSRILVVDDNTDTARGLARLLKLIGNEVRIANDGPSAIQVARELRPDFVLLDIGLPGMDGYQVASVLREDPCCRNALIIAISGYGQAEDRRRSLAAGFDHHLVKPVDFDSLVSLIGSAS